jgi:hypothetical protein
MGCCLDFRSNRLPVAFVASIIAAIFLMSYPPIPLAAVGLCLYPIAIGVLIVRAGLSYSGRNIWKFLSMGVATLMIVFGLVPVFVTKFDSSISTQHIQFPGYIRGLGFRV